MELRKCLLPLLVLVCLAEAQQAQPIEGDSAAAGGLLDRGYRAAFRVYEDCQQRNVGVSACLKKKAITFFDRLGRIDSLPISENLELVKAPGAEPYEPAARNLSDVEATLGRTSGASRDEALNDILLDRVSALMNGFNGRGKMKKMMGMMMMGMAMKMAAMIPIAMGVLFLLAGKALIISKIALVLSMIIGLKKLLQQKQGGDSHGWQSGGGGGGGGGWDRSLKDVEHAHNLAYAASK
ncbi:unnamed protein product [Trichogramma brassicae]|uniref:Protein osiris 12 n=1 Tax=Trichogramma brassicae TaxID=86971 RepID=A0A6H5J8H2_9HYME|nr:unnamed protein product [Trichogramma brassicae]